MAKIAGGSVMSLQVYVTRHHGADAFDRVLDTMPADVAQPLRGIVLPVAWYPTESFVRAIETAHSMFDDGALYESYGAFAADFEIHAFQRFALRFTSPTYLMTKAGSIWHRVHDSGEWTVTGSGKTMRGELRDFAIVNANYCRVLAAWIRRAAEMTGVAGNAVAHPQCRARGDDVCVFAGEWT